MANFPTSLDTLSNPSAGNNTNSPSHAQQHGDANDAIEAIEAKVGIGATTPTVSKLLVGTGSGTSAWQGLTSAQLLAILSDETGTGSAVFATTPTLVTPKVDTINENTPANGVTIDGLNIKDNALNTNNSVPTAAIQDSAVTSDKVAAGAVVQRITAQYQAVGTGTTVIPIDDTIPQNTEGDQYMSQAITPKSATNILVIQMSALLASSSTGTLVHALFQDSTANALAADPQYYGTANAFQQLTLAYAMVAGTTSSITFKYRAGLGGAGTTTFNGAVGARYFGAIPKSSITIWETKA